jgi:hypothetical protein
VLARDIMVGCGGKWIHWSTLNDLVKTPETSKLQSIIYGDHQKDLANNALLVISQMNRNMEAWRRREPGRGLELPALLEFLRTRGCKETVDRVWGAFRLVHPSLRQLAIEEH